MKICTACYKKLRLGLCNIYRDEVALEHKSICCQAGVLEIDGRQYNKTVLELKEKKRLQPGSERMSKKIDKQECARLVVEAAVLIQNIRDRHGAFDKMSNKPRRIYEKSFHKFYNRVHALDTIVAESGDGTQEIYVERYTEDTPEERQCMLMTPAWNTILFDIADFDKG